MVGLSDPDDVEILLSSHEHVEKGSSYKNLHPWLKTGLLTSHETFLIPANTEVFLLNYHIHRNPKHWPESEKFDPNRSQGRHPFSYVPFSVGPRNCIGQKFGLMELKSLVARILCNFELEPIDRISDMKILCDLVIRPTHPVRVKKSILKYSC